MPTPFYDRFHEFEETTRWCTPSIHPELPQTTDIYENDMSISFHDLGSPLNNSGVFKEAADLAAEAYSADHTLLGVNGTTGSNFIVIRALSHQFGGKARMLSTRNAHLSVTNAAYDYNVDLDFIPPVIDDSLQVFLPNSSEQILGQVEKERPDVLLLSNPTYEGASLDLPTVVKGVREVSPETVVYVDEAWGAHFPFSDKLPTSAMQANADICTQSTHKQGNALQQTSMIHWRDGLIDESTLRSSYRALSTTSPSFHLLAALDASRDFMQRRGAAEIDKIIGLANEFTEYLRAIGALSVHTFDDPTKLLLNLPDKDAPSLAHELEKQGIIPEKSDLHNLLLIVGFQNTKEDAKKTTEAIEGIVRDLPDDSSHSPRFPRNISRSTVEAGSIPSLVPVEKAVGMICLESIVPYPPGIPLLTRGELITDEHIEYLEAVSTNRHIEIISSQLGSILVAG
jgi:arginine/lysine/ornithine decarboxylase